MSTGSGSSLLVDLQVSPSSPVAAHLQNITSSYSSQGRPHCNMTL